MKRKDNDSVTLAMKYC